MCDVDILCEFKKIPIVINSSNTVIMKTAAWFRQNLLNWYDYLD